MARISTGSLWPDGTLCACGDVLLFSAEDDAGDTLRPRLEAAGADLQRVHVVRAVADEYLGNGIRPERVFCLERDLPALEAKLAELSSVSLIVIDPITAFLGHADDHRNGEVRGLLAPLADLAARYEAAIVAITHLNKGTANGAAVLLRIIGSIAFAGAGSGGVSCSARSTGSEQAPVRPDEEQPRTGSGRPCLSHRRCHHRQRRRSYRDNQDHLGGRSYFNQRRGRADARNSRIDNSQVGGDLATCRVGRWSGSFAGTLQQGQECWLQLFDLATCAGRIEGHHHTDRFSRRLDLEPTGRRHTCSRNPVLKS